METRKIDDEYSVAGQLAPRDVEVAHAMGFRSILCLRPDDEPGPDGTLDADQAIFDEIAASARISGMEPAQLPVPASGPTEAHAARFAEIMEALPKPVLAYCRTGGRAVKIREMAG